MKKFQKLLVLMLAVVLTAGCFGSLPVKAAAAPKLGVSKKTIFVGGSQVSSSYKETYSLYFKNRPESYKISWSTSNADVVEITKKTKYRAVLKGLKPGTATISAKVTDNSTKVVTTYKCKVTVKQNCAAVAITNKTAVKDMKPGDTLTLTASMYKADGSVAKKGTDTTDTIRYASADPKVATVDNNGKVTAVAPGETTITCYTVQSTTGTYSVLEKATHKDTVNVKVITPEMLKSVEQTAVNQFVVKFNSPVDPASIKSDSFVLKTSAGVTAALKTIEPTTDGLTVTITTKSNLVSKLSYILTYGNESKGFTAVDTSAPTSITISTPGNVAIVGQATQLKVKFFNGNVDITPAEGSTEYTNMVSKMSYSTNPPYSADWYIASSGLLTFHNAGKTAEVIGKYKPNWYSLSDSDVLTAAVSISSVDEASIIEFDKVIVTNSNKPGKDLDWEKENSYICAGDSGYKLVARMKKVTTGEYIYSTDAGSKIQFDIPSDSKTNSPLYIGANSGEILAVAEGVAQVLVFYGDSTNMANVKSVAQVAVAGARIPANMIISKDGKPVDSTIVSGQFGMEKMELTATVYDQYGEIIKLTDANIAAFGYSFEGGKTGPVPVITANEDGTASIVADPLGFTDYKAGSTSVYSYKFSYTSGKIVLNQGLTLIIQMPDSRFAATYKLEMIGKADTTVTSSMTELPKLTLKLYDLRDGIKYAEKPLVPKSQATANGQFFYQLMGPKGEITTGLGTNVISLVTEGANSTLNKLPQGSYTLMVYEKSAGGNIARASAAFVITDGQEAVKIERKKSSTTVKISTGMSEADKKSAFLDCFSVKVGASDVAASGIELVIPQIMDGVMYVSTVKVTDIVSVGDKLYTQKYEISLSEAILN